MSLKRTDLAKRLALKISQQMKHAGVPGRFADESASQLDRREQRKLDQAAGLVPFAVKLHDDLVKQLRALAEQEGGHLNEVTERLLRAGLAANPVAVAAEKSEPKKPTPSKKPVKADDKKSTKKADKAADKKPVKKADKPADTKAAPKKVASKKAAAKKAPAKKASSKKA